MKNILPSCIHWLATRTMWVALALIGVTGMVTSAMAAGPALQGSINIRSLSPQDITDYGLTNAQKASGLTCVGVGQPAYLDALVNIAIAPTNIVSVTWSLTNKPAGSAAVLGSSPLGTNVPTANVTDQLVYQVAGRTVLNPDLTGQYIVTATILTTGSGTTNVTQSITAATYMGVNTCALCHSGGIIADDKYHTWAQTPHATYFTRAINGQVSSHYSQNCIACHTLGYDTNSTAVNGGFDDIAKQLGWTFPISLNTNNWAAMPASLQNLANIQCESCHGPGSEHAMALGNTNVSNWPRIGVTFDSGNCAQCHDNKPTGFRTSEWKHSGHAITTRTPSGANRIMCVRCHTPGGFTGYLDHLGSTNAYTTNFVYGAIGCTTCHDSHDASQPHQLRDALSVTLGDGTVVANAGAGALCMNCHQSRNGSVTNSIVKYPLGQTTWNGGSAFGVHDNPAADMLEGANGYTYGKAIPSSAHRFAVTNTCAGCHMQPVTATDPAFTLAGGHSFNMSYNAITNGITNTVDMVNVCIQCHGTIPSFDMVREDYNGDGVIEGVQTEVQHLLDKVSTLLPPTNYVASGNYVADGLVKTPSARTNWQAKFLEAAYNWQFVANDKSFGIHNAPYAVGLLKASIADLTGDANNDGLPDWWQVQYFGSATNPLAAPGATPAGDGIPNWLKFNLGLNPLAAGATIPGGFVWGPSLADPGSNTNTIAIYTAAEIAFATQVGTSYQVQSISSLGGSWQNVGGSIAGTGTEISYVTPTRTSPLLYFRVVHTP